MKKSKVKITTLFLDIGGVLLTNGWDRNARKRAAQKFDLDYDDMEARHNLTFDTYEQGKISLAVYLERIVFYKRRSFSQKQFQEFMFVQSKPFKDMIELISKLKKKYGFKIAVVSNEGRELNDYRVKKFKLKNFVDFFISSSYVHLRKPDPEIYHMALDIAQVNPKEVLYIEDRPLFVQVAHEVGINGLLHVDFQTTRQKLQKLGYGA